ncbi:MAG TPA: hypothetical protein VIV06_03440 [Candidatus Limnocylindrales bacterium]
MTRDQDLDRLLGQWFDDGPTHVPDRVIDAVADRIGRQPQRPAWRLQWRRLTMNSRLTIAAAFAAVVLVAGIGYALLPAQPAGVGGTAGSPPPAPATPSASPSASNGLASMLPGGSLVPGVYRARPLLGISALSVTFAVPDGWSGYPDWAVLGPKGTGAPEGTGVGFLSADGLFSDPCHWDAKGDGSWPQRGDITVGPTAADLADALLAHGGYAASRLPDVSVGGYGAIRVDLQVPSDIDLNSCDRVAGTNRGSYFVWGTRHLGGSDLYAQGPANRWHLWIVDSGDARLIIAVTDYAGTPASDQAAARAIVDSVTLEP